MLVNGRNVQIFFIIGDELTPASSIPSFCAGIAARQTPVAPGGLRIDFIGFGLVVHHFDRKNSASFYAIFPVKYDQICYRGSE